jgi:hypothetical protein
MPKSAEAVLAVAKCCPLLQDVELEYAERLGDREVTALAHGWPHLRTLNIVGTSFTFKGVHAIRDHSRALERIYLNVHMFPGGSSTMRSFPRVSARQRTYLLPPLTSVGVLRTWHIAPV